MTTRTAGRYRISWSRHGLTKWVEVVDTLTGMKAAGTSYSRFDAALDQALSALRRRMG